jgi:hypothetical protein
LKRERKKEKKEKEKKKKSCWAGQTLFGPIVLCPHTPAQHYLAPLNSFAGRWPPRISPCARAGRCSVSHCQAGPVRQPGHLTLPFPAWLTGGPVLSAGFFLNRTRGSRASRTPCTAGFNRNRGDLGVRLGSPRLRG